MDKKDEMILGAAVTPSMDETQVIISKAVDDKAQSMLRAQNIAFYLATQLLYADQQKQIKMSDNEREELEIVFEKLKDIIYAKNK